MKLYRVNKLTKRGGVVVKKNDILANSDQQAIQHAKDHLDCPVCDVLRDGDKVASIV